MNVPAKIMAGLAVCMLLGVGLCGAGGVTGGVTHSDKIVESLYVAGAVCFFGGLLLMFVFGIGWLIAAIGKSLFEKKGKD
jgi:hypothetical protein